MRKLRPVRSIRSPGYPAQSETQANPALLQKPPERWRQCGRVVISAGLMASLALPLSACEPTPPPLAGVPMPPEAVTESNALNLIRTASGGLLARFQPGRPGDTAVRFVQYNTSSKVLEEVKPSSEDLELDAFDAEMGIGIEYIGSEAESPDDAAGFTATGEVIEHADKDSAYVLVIPTAYDYDAGDNAGITEQIESFVEWLKSEGLI